MVVRQGGKCLRYLWQREEIGLRVRKCVWGGVRTSLFIYVFISMYAFIY